MSRSSWPGVPPEVPPPWRPEPPPGEPSPAPPPPVPLVPTPAGPGREHEDALAPLLRRGIVMVTGELHDAEATRAAAQLMTLNAERDDAVTLHLNCPDGDLDAALLLADTIDLMTVEVTAACRGTLGGPALAPFAVAGRRECSAHATFRMSEPRADVSGRTHEIDAEAAALRAQLDRLVARIAEATGQAAERIATDMDRGRVLDAEDAHAYGLVHAITRSARTDR